MIVIAAKISASAADIEKLTPAIQKMVDESLKEPGCHDYGFAQDLNDPDALRIFECWESDQDLADHFATPHMAEFQAAMAGVTVKGMDAKRYVIESVGPLQTPGR